MTLINFATGWMGDATTNLVLKIGVGGRQVFQATLANVEFEG